MPRKYKELTDAKLADDYGKLRAELAPLQRKEEELKMELVARRKKRFVGKLFVVNVSRFNRMLINNKLIAKAMREPITWLDQFRRPSPTCVVSIEAANTHKERKEGAANRRKAA